MAAAILTDSGRSATTPWSEIPNSCQELPKFISQFMSPYRIIRVELSPLLDHLFLIYQGILSMPINRFSPMQGQNLSPPAASHTETAQSSRTQQIPLMDEHRNLAPLANVSFAANCPKELTEIAPYVFRAFNKITKTDFNKIHVKPITEEIEHDVGTITDATTEPHPTLRAVTIEIGGHAEPELSHDQKLARYALNLTHEAFLHGAYYFEMFDRHEKGSQEPFKSEYEQHRSIVHPPNDQNPYLNVVRHVLQHLPDRNALRVEFLKAYTNDVYSHMIEDLSEDAQEPVRQWLGRLDDMSENPRDPLWSALAMNQQRTNITQVLMRTLGYQ